ncbi:MAG: IS200/IS605 family element transposase accessory protein TnpB, partial [Trueperella pyogenes]|nr:IS200/IS605 family element transposase accessory protein TnpB [Trueperella pyogenes]
MSTYEAVKVQLDPTPRQARLLVSHAGAARFAYNAGLAHVKDMLENGEPPEWSHYALVRWWNANKDTLAVNPDTGVVWWSQNSKEAYSMALRDLAQALSNWSKSRKGQRKGRRVGFPRFKSKNAAMRFAYSTAFTTPIASDPYGLKLPRIGRVHCMENVFKRVNGAHLVRVSVSYRAGRWYASLTVEREPSPVSRPKRGAVGVDLGIKHLTTLSDGTVIPNPRALDTRLKALRKAQQALSRKTKGSARREKAKEHVARLHARIADARMDAINKATTMIARTYTTVCIEDLNVAGMMKNHSLARSVSDASLGEFRRQLEYKTARTGASLRVVDRWYPSSKTCSNCGTVKAKLSLSERVYQCDVCGLSIDRDLNAAINLMVAGSAPETLNARGGDVRRADTMSGNADPSETRTKQSPTGGMRLGAGLGNETM